ncbi:aspartate dehydrogenase domain-containing protein [Amycolatopsis methanolica]|uniref:aspartate dehydrogenase domain-containing protein n=1 Tax=Amycolatopsis methanolica TaxID=1814 RepID=UPI00344A8AD2
MTAESLARSEAGVDAMRVGLVGYGAIGRQVVEALIAGRVPGAVLAGIMDKAGAPEEFAVADVDALVDTADIIVEAAGSQALQEIAPAVLERGGTLLAVSTGAFLRPAVRPLLDHPGPGRIILSTGAIAGLDLIRAARLSGSGVRVNLRTMKRPPALVQPWMSDEQRDGLQQARPGDAPSVVFSGGPEQAAELFPANLNVAAALALAVDSPEAVHVELVADPNAERTRHEVTVTSDLGVHRFVLENYPSPANPATSALVAWAVLRCLADLGPRARPAFR